MPASPQWWNAGKTAQIISETSSTVAAGSAVAAATFWLFNDKGSLLGATTMTGYYLIPEASFDGGLTWLRSGPKMLNERWIEASITGNVDSTGGAISAQTVTYTPIGTSVALPITTIPQGCGREIGVRVTVPLGASDAAVKWRLVVDTVSALEAWVTPAFNAADFTAAAPMTWTLQAGDVQTYAYRLRDTKTMLLSFTLVTTTTGGTATNEIRVKIPGGFIAAKTMANSAVIFEGTHVEGYCEVVAGGTYMSIYKKAGNYALSTNALFVRGQLEFEVQ